MVIINSIRTFSILAGSITKCCRACLVVDGLLWFEISAENLAENRGSDLYGGRRFAPQNPQKILMKIIESTIYELAKSVINRT